MKIPKQEYTAEFKLLAVKRVKDGSSIGAAARELGWIGFWASSPNTA